MPKVEKVRGGPQNGKLVPSRVGSTQNMAANIKVAVRVRPLNAKETQLNTRTIIDLVDDSMLVFDPKEEPRPFFYHGVKQPNNNFLKRANKELKFVFDHVCGPESSNINVFDTTTKDMIMCLMEGYNCSVFVYGATGAGKTFTMIGSKENPGITYLTMDHLFNTINSFKNDRDFDIAVSYIEVYNENVYDLIKPSKTPLQLREDSKYGVMVAGLTLNNINTARELLNMLENGNKNRTQHPTDANAESSRSHAVFQVYVKMRYKTSCELRIVKLSMIDLAGSERASATGCVGERFKEGANINRSLLSLGNCINKLADGSNYIPYRDSKLTRLLKDSLGGNCKTVMIANISPSSISYEDTYNTLKYAARANKIQLNIKKNIMDGSTRVSQYVQVVNELKKKVKELEAKLSLSSVHKGVIREPDMAKEQAKKEWRRLIYDQQKVVNSLVSQLLSLRSRQRLLALRHRLRTDAYSQVADLAHRSSSEAIEQVYTEDIPRQGRAADSYIKQTVRLDSMIHTAWHKWHDTHIKLEALLDQALSECPELEDFIKNVKLDSELRLTKARDNLRYKLLSIALDEVNSLREYTSDMPSMLRKLYLTLKGYGKTHPALADKYLEIMKKAKSVKTITWSDQDSESEAIDTHFKFISTLDLDKPSITPDYLPAKIDINMAPNIDTDSENFSDVENQEPVKVTPRKRKSTPIKLLNNETIVIDDSFEYLDTMKMVNSAKKIKKEPSVVRDMENFVVIDPKDLNSTFVLAGKLDGFKKEPIEMKTESPQIKKEFKDRTNTMGQTQRPPNPTGRAQIVKPVQMVKATVFKKATQQRSTTPGFGSSLARDGTPLQRNVQARKATTLWNSSTVNGKHVVFGLVQKFLQLRTLKRSK